MFRAWKKFCGKKLEQSKIMSTEYGTKPLGEFVREIVGLDMNAAKEAFSAYLTDTSLDEQADLFCESDC